jgi:hypothetical protein
MMSRIAGMGETSSVKVIRRGDAIMRRGLIIFLSCLLLATLSVMFNDRVGAQDDIINIEHKDAFKGLQRPSVKFTHEKHADRYSDCIQCHHTYEYKGGKRVNDWNGEGQPCSECHKAQEDGKKLSLMNSFHESCTACHRSLYKEGKKAGPVTCGECHIR